MSHLHFIHAREIKRVLELAPNGLTRAQLFESMDLPEKEERWFGEVLSELCQSKRQEVEMVKEPGTFTIYKLRASYVDQNPPPTSQRRAVARPTSMPAPATGYRCACGALLTYGGRGPKPKKCADCKRRQAKTRVEAKRARCPTCGHRLKDAA